MRRAILPLLTALFVACGTTEEQLPPLEVVPANETSSFAIYPVDWNVTQTDVGEVRLLTDFGDTLVFFGPTAATVMVAGTIVGSSEGGGPFRDAALIPSADNSGEWVVAINDKGRVMRVLLHNANVEDVGERYGLETTDVRAVARLDDTTVAFLLPDGIALADGTKVTRWNIGGGTDMSADSKRIVVIGPDDVRVFDRATSSLSSFPVKGARDAAFAADGTLYVAVGNTLYAHRGGALVSVATTPAEITGITRAKNRLWLSAGTELGLIDNNTLYLTSGTDLAPEAVLTGSTTGDVWALAPGNVRRFGATGGVGAAGTWTEHVKPIFDGNCRACHMPGGAGVDLSTFERWNVMRTKLMKRLVVEKTMPPTGSKVLSEVDRETLRKWLTGQLDEVE